MNAQSSQEQWRALLCTCSQSPLFRSSVRLLDHYLLHYKDPLTTAGLVEISFSFFFLLHTHTHTSHGGHSLCLLSFLHQVSQLIPVHHCCHS